jgi:diguanylate cyclase (GGDEF)-like protein/PAS domain S-box-containing protein
MSKNNARSMFKFFYMPKENLLLRYGIILTLVCFLTGTLIYFLAYQVITDNVKRSLLQIAEQGAERVHDKLDGYLGILENIASIDTIKDPAVPWQRKQAIIQSFAARKYLNLKRISIADGNGHSRTSDGNSLVIKDRTYFRKAISGSKYVSEPLISRNDGTAVIIFAVPVFYRGHITSVLYATHPVEALCKITDSIRMSSRGYSFITNKKNQLIAHPDRDLVYSGEDAYAGIQNIDHLKPLAAIQRKMAAGKTGTGEYVYNGVKKYVGYAPIKGTDWSFGITAPKEALFGHLNQILICLGLLLCLVFILFTVLNMNNISLQQSLTREQNFLNSAIDTANIIIIETDFRGKITGFNRYAEEKLAFSQTEIIDHAFIYDLVPEEYSGQIAEICRKTENLLRIEFPLIRKSGEMIHILWSINSNASQHFVKEADKITMMGVDITERVAYEQKLLENNKALSLLYEELASSEEELRQLAYFDPLTGLPNRFSLFEHSAVNIANAVAQESQMALLYLDIDNFKLINDTFGHSIGDLLLMEIGVRLSSILKNYEVFRLGGDEFVALISDIHDSDSLKSLTTNIMIDFTRPFNVEQHVFHISLSMGITFFPDNGQNIEDLLKNADTAMYRAKESGKNLCVFFDRSMNDSIVEKVQMESDLRLALENRELFIVYQPQVEASTGLVVGFEALLRWKNSKYDGISPNKFIKIAEETGLIFPIGLWVLEDACRFTARLQQESIQGLTISINISTRQLMQNDFVASIKQIVTKAGIAPQKIGLEITETALMESFETNLEKLQLIREHGIGIHLDDFGTGYSSLNYLRSLPINIIKIDKSFLDDIRHGVQQSLITTIISLAHQINLKVIAEGVETKEQLQFLLDGGCDFIQGFLFSRPVYEEEALCIAREGRLKLVGG